MYARGLHGSYVRARPGHPAAASGMSSSVTRGVSAGMSVRSLLWLPNLG
jgi:hypothetical protein